MRPTVQTCCPSVLCQKHVFACQPDHFCPAWICLRQGNTEGQWVGPPLRLKPYPDVVVNKTELSDLAVVLYLNAEWIYILSHFFCNHFHDCYDLLTYLASCIGPIRSSMPWMHQIMFSSLSGPEWWNLLISLSPSLDVAAAFASAF